MSSPKITVLVIHYENTVTDEEIRNCIHYLEAQTYTNFEVLFIHDGPRKKEYPLDETSLNYKIIDTSYRYNDCGHSLRDLGIRRARGEYILFMNADNKLYPNALEEIYKTSIDTVWDSLCNSDIIIFPIYMIGVLYTGIRIIANKQSKLKERMKVILTGYPARRYLIDCMQLVMTRKKWLQYGGWKNKSEESDGIMYQELVTKNKGARYCSSILGEHR